LCYAVTNVEGKIMFVWCSVRSIDAQQSSTICSPTLFWLTTVSQCHCQSEFFTWLVIVIAMSPQK